MAYLQLNSQRVAWTENDEQVQLDVGAYQGVGFAQLSHFLLSHRFSRPKSMAYTAQFVDVSSLRLSASDFYPLSEDYFWALSDEMNRSRIQTFQPDEIFPFLLARPKNADQSRLKLDLDELCRHFSVMRRLVMGAVIKIETGNFPSKFLP